MKDKKWLKYLIIAFGVIVIITIGIILTINANKPKVSDFNEKIKHELEYLDTSTLYMINDLNNLNDVNSLKVEKMSVDSSSSNSESGGGSYSSSDESQTSSQSSNSESEESKSYEIQDNSIMVINKDQIDWASINTQAEDLYDSWVNITIDLNSASVSNENILAFSDNLNNLLVCINNQDKANSIICLANLYSLIPKYMSETSLDQNAISLENVKSNIISAYSLVTSGNWDEINTFLTKAEAEYDTLMNSTYNLNEVKRAKFNRCYVLLKELIKTSNAKDENIFYLKYINLMNEIDKISF